MTGSGVWGCDCGCWVTTIVQSHGPYNIRNTIIGPRHIHSTLQSYFTRPQEGEAKASCKDNERIKFGLLLLDETNYLANETYQHGIVGSSVETLVHAVPIYPVVMPRA